MTFKDTSVLINDEEEQNEDHNVLENIELQSSFKQKMQQRRKQQQTGGIDESRSILPQYDDQEEAEIEERRKTRITLVGEGATAGRSKQEALDLIREKLAF